MNAVSKRSIRRVTRPSRSLHLLGLAVGLGLQAIASPSAHASGTSQPQTVQVKLTEWKVLLTPEVVPPGPVLFEVTNTGSIPHAFEVEGRGLEKSTPQIKPGAKATLQLDLGAGKYEAYCPVGKGSHKMLGMMDHLTVGGPERAATKPSAVNDSDEMGGMGGMAMVKQDDDDEANEYGTAAKMIKLVGAGPVIQILPGPFPFADSAMAVIQDRPADQQADLTKKSHMGPYSNNVAKITGDISLTAIDRGATGDSVSGVARFTAQDGTRWKAVMDRVQTKDIPFNPRFGGVIMGLFYHGASGVHTPLVPTIKSSVALWAFAHLYKNDQLVADNAMVHIMLLSRTRRTKDWALDCWDCSNHPIEELQLQITAAPNTPPFDAPGGFLFVNWEKTSGKAEPLAAQGASSGDTD